MKMVQSSIALACLLAGADAFGAMPDSTTGPSHVCVLDAGGDGVVMAADNTWCGRDGASHCEDFPDEVVGQIFGKGCADLVCDGSMVVSTDPNPIIAQLVKGWCPLKCDNCGEACEDKPWLLGCWRPTGPASARPPLLPARRFRCQCQCQSRWGRGT